MLYKPLIKTSQSIHDKWEVKLGIIDLPEPILTPVLNPFGHASMSVLC